MNAGLTMRQTKENLQGHFVQVRMVAILIFLMSWNEQMNEVFTLIHELGHAGHLQIRMNINRILIVVHLYTLLKRHRQ